MRRARGKAPGGTAARNGTTYVGTLEDDLGTIRVVSCDACHTTAVDAWDGHRKRRSGALTYVDPRTRTRGRGGPDRILGHLRQAFAQPPRS